MTRPATGSVLVSLAALVLLAAACLRADPIREEMAQKVEIAKPNPPSERDTFVVLPPPPRNPEQAVRAEPPAAPAGEASSDKESQSEPSSRDRPIRTQAERTRQPPGQTGIATQNRGGSAPNPPAPLPKEITVDRQAVQEGRILLVMMAEGKGPDIEIAWPDNGDSRERLYRLLSTCYGMKSAVLQQNGALFAAGGEPGKPWEINRDYYSSFLREPRGRFPAAERRTIGKIEAYHGVRGTAVRILPRVVDAGIVGALFNLAGSGTRNDAAITAHYDFDEEGLVVSGISAGGRSIGGVLRVPGIVRSCQV